MTSQASNYQIGDHVRVTQQIPRGQETTSTTFEGVIVRAGQQKTGSWFAHSKDKKLWLDRLELKLADGELVTVNLDQFSRVESAD
ncbi:MAG: 50S ribosomal protein L19 [Phycisphaerales bacterium]